ncbi:MAG TPA: MMPL family transporter [Opitutaceae bacterium]|nr:MMPL family transporter [Opitutaceae bacterium]
MEFRHPKLLARGALALFAGLCLLHLARLDFSRRISTSVLDLIPPEGDAPELRALRGLAGDREARVALFALAAADGRGAPDPEAVRRFSASLAGSPAFAEVSALGDSGAAPQAAREIFRRRSALLLPSWLGRRAREFAAAGLPPEGFSPWLAEKAAADLEAFLSRPEAAGLQELVTSDPLLLTPSLIDQARDLAPAAAAAGGPALVWTRTAASPFEEAGQAPVFAAVERALAAARSADPGATLRWSAVARLAAASRRQIEREMKLLNLLSLAGVLLIASLCVRRPWQLAHLAPVILCSLLGAWTATTLAFARVHILVFVLGSLLTGVAVDYGFYIYMQPWAAAEETYGAKVRRLLRPLLASCLTTVIGFSLLLASDLPLIRQLGFFVSAGLLAALGAALLYFAQLRRPWLESRAWGPLAGRRLPPAWPVAAGALAAAIALAGPWRLRWRDDIRELDLPSPALAAEDQAVRALFGAGGSREAYLTSGSDLAEARRHLEDFQAFAARARPGIEMASLGLVLPTAEDWNALPGRLHDLRAFPADFRSALDRHGFNPESFAAFFQTWDGLVRQPPAGDYGDLGRGLRDELTGPLGGLARLDGPRPWFITLATGPEIEPLPAGLETAALSQLQSLNRLFAHYRASALRLSLCGLALVIGSVFLLYPSRRGLRIALIPAGSCFFVFGCFGICGQTLNLFHLLGAFLGICLSHNYAIFSAESSAAGRPPPAPVRLSALCAAASFGVLALSRIPVVHSLGLTVALIVLSALAAIEIEAAARTAP